MSWLTIKSAFLKMMYLTTPLCKLMLIAFINISFVNTIFSEPFTDHMYLTEFPSGGGGGVYWNYRVEMCGIILTDFNYM